MERPELLGIGLFDLTGKTALVTGAGRGLGRSMALALAAAGASVAVGSRTAAEIEGVRDEIRALGVRSEAFTADCSREADCERLVASTIEGLGQLDILVNNAGIMIRKPLSTLTIEDFREVLGTNLEGYFLCTRAAGRHMLARGSGKVINISSILGHVALTGMGAYASSKGAVEQFTRALAVEWAQAGIQVNAIAPTFFEANPTLYQNSERNRFVIERTPMGRWGQPHELAGAVIFLASRASDYVTGHSLLVDGGWTAS